MKKKLALFMAVFMALMTLAACGGGGTSSGAATGSTDGCNAAAGGKVIRFEHTYASNSESGKGPPHVGDGPH